MGLGLGCAMSVGPLFITELVPATFRGQLVALSDISINVGILLGYTVSFIVEACITSTNYDWRIMIACGLLPPILLMTSLYLVPESPRWLIMIGSYQNALDVLNIITRNEEECIKTFIDIEESFALIQDNTITVEKENTLEPTSKPTSKTRTKDEDDNETADQERDSGTFNKKTKYSKDELESSISSASNTTTKSSDTSVIFIEGAGEKYISYLNFLAICIAIFQQTGGSEVCVYYSPTLLQQAGVKDYDTALAYCILIGLSKLIGDFIGAYLLDRWGRRPLLLLSASGQFISVVGIGFGLKYGSWIIVLCLLCIFMCFFSIGLGIASYLLCNEILPPQSRARTMGYCIFGNRTLTGLNIIMFLNISDNTSMGNAYLYGFSIGAAISLIFHFIFTPETKSKTLEEIQESEFKSFKRRLSRDNIPFQSHGKGSHPDEKGGNDRKEGNQNYSEDYDYEVSTKSHGSVSNYVVGQVREATTEGISTLRRRVTSLRKFIDRSEDLSSSGTDEERRGTATNSYLQNNNNDGDEETVALVTGENLI